MRSYVKICCFFLLTLLLIGCVTDEACRQNRDSLLGVKLYRVVYDSETESYINQAYSLPLKVLALGNDSVLYDYSISQMELPLRRTIGNTSFQLTDTVNQITDTLLVSYQVTDAFKSIECGCVPTFQLLSADVTTNNIDSVVIVQSAVKTSNTVNLNLYYRNNTSN